MPNHQFYIVENEVYSFININTCLIPKILSIMYGGVHFQECYNRDGGYCSNMIIICRISLFTVYYIVKNKVYSFLNFNTCLIPKILSIMYGGVHFQECYNRDGSHY